MSSNDSVSSTALTKTIDGDNSQQANGDFRRSPLDSAAAFLDRNLQLVRVSVVSLALGGVFLLVRALAWRFSHADDIPIDLIERQVLLRARFLSIGDDGTLFAQHSPLLDFRRAGKSELALRFAAISLNPGSEQFVNDMFARRRRRFSFRALKRNENHQLECIVHQRQRLRRVNVNVDLVRRRLARFQPDSSLDSAAAAVPDAYANLCRRLVQAELYADRVAARRKRLNLLTAPFRFLARRFK